jgi:D-proline reductase (dithiol) PrdB
MGTTSQSTPDSRQPIADSPIADSPIPYIQRTRDYYLALGYGNPYRWAHFDDVPFTPLAKPLAEARLALITTAAPYQPEAGDQGPGAAYNAAAKFYSAYSAPTDSPPDLRISHLTYDRTHTTAADPNTWFPLAQLRLAVARGRLGALTTRFHGVPTNRSQRATVQSDAPEILRRCQEDGADVALLVPT